MLPRQLNPLQQQQQQKRVTILIEGHGDEDIQQEFPEYKNKTIRLMSFCGRSGDSGEMRLIQTDTGQKSLDTEKLNYLQTLYQNYNKDLFLDSAEGLRELYKSFGVRYDETNTGGFTITTPVRNRSFNLEPNPHENCRVCIERGADMCLPKRIKNQGCSEYGIIVLHSTIPEDLPFTLVGRSGSFPRDTYGNLNESQPTMEYWTGKVLSNPNIDRELKTQLITKILSKKNVPLTLIVLFFIAAGFDYVDIYDPTCRAFSGRKYTEYGKSVLGLVEQGFLPRSYLRRSVNILHPETTSREQRLAARTALTNEFPDRRPSTSDAIRLGTSSNKLTTSSCNGSGCGIGGKKTKRKHKKTNYTVKKMTKNNKKKTIRNMRNTKNKTKKRKI